MIHPQQNSGTSVIGKFTGILGFERSSVERTSAGGTLWSEMSIRLDSLVEEIELFRAFLGMPPSQSP